jgi:ferredoxin
LKPARLILSLLCLFLFTLYFLAGDLIPQTWGKFLPFFQFVPALYKGALAGVSFIILRLGLVLLLTLALGRIYCSLLCPLGVWQDIFIYLSRKLKVKRRFSFRPLPPWLQYTLPVITVSLFLAGFSLVLYLLDPYSIFGRGTTLLIKPLAVLAGQRVEGLLKGFGVYAFAAEELPVPALPVLAFVGCFTAGVLAAAFFMGRIYCNTVCPVGALLGLFSRFSLSGFRFDRDRCTHCRRCEQVCKSECLDSKNLIIDKSRCVSCFNCLKACPSATLTYGPRWSRLPGSKTDLPTDLPTSLPTETPTGDPAESHADSPTGSPAGSTRRDFLKRSTAFFLTGLVVMLRNGLKPARLWAAPLVTTPPEAGNPASDPVTKQPAIPSAVTPVFPPGGESLERFNRLCTACQLCVAKCPTRVLTPSLLVYVWGGFLQPSMDYDRHFCEYECHTCTQVCPSGALKALTLEEKKQTQMGQVRFEKALCVVETNGTACGACAEICPTHAVYMIPYKNGLTLPATDTASCVGCGGCQSACPVRPSRAIKVAGLSRHGLATRPQSGLPGPTESGPRPEGAAPSNPEDFPF